MPGTADRPLVLVTGATGFIAGHCIRDLLEHGYRVRGTVRSLARPERSAHLRALAERLDSSLELVEADLGSDDGWTRAVADCTYVLHVASPNPSAPPKHESDLIEPAVQGTLRVLTAAAATASVRRIVLTSSIAAVITGHQDGRTHTEDDWSDLDRCPAYAKSKTLAEKAAWAFVDDLPEEDRLELAVVNPGLTLGPMLDPDSNTSLEVIGRLMKRQVPASPRIGFAVVDVRDLATAHRLAMERPEAAGHRYICAGEHVWMQDMAGMLAEQFGPQGHRIPTGRLPAWVMRVLAVFDPSVRLALQFLGKEELLSSEKAHRELGWSLRPARISIHDAGRSMIEHGLVKRGGSTRPGLTAAERA